MIYDLVTITVDISTARIIMGAYLVLIVILSVMSWREA